MQEEEAEAIMAARSITPSAEENEQSAAGRVQTPEVQVPATVLDPCSSVTLF